MMYYTIQIFQFIKSIFIQFIDVWLLKKKNISKPFILLYIITFIATYKMNKVLLFEIFYINVILFLYYLYFNLSLRVSSRRKIKKN